MHRGQGSAVSGQHDIALLELIALLGLAAGVWVTWPLWTGGQSLPQIPWFAAATGMPVTVDRWLVGLAALAAVAIVCGWLAQRVRSILVAAQVVFAVAAVSLVLLNQHRLQAWVLHLLSVLCLLWLSPNERGLSLVRMFAISVYVHSAISRCDRASLELQWNLVTPLLERWDIATEYVADRVRLAWAGLFAVAEFVIALLLAVPRLRGWGRRASIGMHAALILLLGPLGLNHHGGVLVWNCVWIAQNWVLFGPGVDRDCEAASDGGSGLRVRGPVATVVAGLLILGPLSEPWGWWDHWPSWRLYSARPETVTVFVHESRLNELPEEVRRSVGPPAPLSEWRPLSLDAWSFSELHCPVYPQERFRLAVALAVTREFRLGDDMRVEIGSSPNRWTGERVVRELRGDEAIAAECEWFSVNVLDRSGVRGE